MANTQSTPPPPHHAHTVGNRDLSSDRDVCARSGRNKATKTHQGNTSFLGHQRIIYVQMRDIRKKAGKAIEGRGKRSTWVGIRDIGKKLH